MASKRVWLVAVGLILAVAGGVALAAGGIPYTDEERVLDVGPLQATAEVERRIDVPPLVAGLALAAGVSLALFGATREGGHAGD